MKESTTVRHASVPKGLSALLRMALVLPALGCQGEFLNPAGPNRDDPTAIGGPGGATGGGADGQGTCAPRLPARVVLLSDFQHVTALRALFGSEAVADDAPRQQLKPFAQKGIVVNTSVVHTRMGWAENAVAALRKDPSAVTGCTTIDAACADTFLRKFLPRAFRRPVDEEEVSELLAVYTLGAEQNPLNGIIRAVEAGLSAPSFMYRRELGTPDEQGTLILDPYELASVISFALTDGPPDEALFAAAESGKLTSTKEIEAQVKRLIATPSAQESLTSTLLSAWGLGNIFGAAKDPVLFPEFTPQLQGSMYRETELLVHDVLWDREAPVNELLSTRQSFVNGSLADLYGVPKPAGDSSEFSAVTLPEERAGILTQASVMAMLARSDTTSVVARGLFVRGLLCMSKVGAPPDNLEDEITSLLAEDMTERERAEVRAKTPSCAGCHAGIDPFGLLLESYDSLGRHRTTLAGEPIDSSVEVPGAASYAGRHEDAAAFLEQVAMGDEFAACATTRLLSYATQDDALRPNDCQVEGALSASDLKTLTMPELVLRALTSPALRTRKKESL